MSDCLFCAIIKGDIPSTCIYEDEQVFVFKDIDPQAPVHFLAVPKEHIPGPADITVENSCYVAHIYEVIAKLAKELGLEKGFRVVANCGEDGGQTVGHLHFHVLAGRGLAWPPG
ncbi:MAG: histidine triad nucleotide-binding protein [Oscillospiraceae bacterium]|nr:histidine triad nucleotide-binding protein [Oscillospiraceae bacterium]